MFGRLGNKLYLCIVKKGETYGPLDDEALLAEPNIGGVETKPESELSLCVRLAAIFDMLGKRRGA